jgi:predicted ABC-type ATPase
MNELYNEEKFEGGGIVLERVHPQVAVEPFIPYYERMGYEVKTNVLPNGWTEIIGEKINKPDSDIVEYLQNHTKDEAYRLNNSNWNSRFISNAQYNVNRDYITNFAKGGRTTHSRRVDARRLSQEPWEQAYLSKRKGNYYEDGGEVCPTCGSFAKGGKIDDNVVFSTPFGIGLTKDFLPARKVSGEVILLSDEEIKSGKYPIIDWDKVGEAIENNAEKFAKGGITEINEDGSNIPPELMAVFNNNYDDDRYGDYLYMEELKEKAREIGYDFDYDLSGTPTEFWKVTPESYAKGGEVKIKEGDDVRGFGHKYGTSVISVDEKNKTFDIKYSDHWDSSVKSYPFSSVKLHEDFEDYTEDDLQDEEVTWVRVSSYDKGGKTKINWSEYYEKGGTIMSKEMQDKLFDSDGARKIDRKSIKELTDYVNSLEQTKSKHFNEKTKKYSPSRQKLHKEILNEFKDNLVCIESDEPIAILMGGSPASGKSTFLRKYAPYLLSEELLRIDADEVRSMLPEYEGWNASQTHLETKDIVNTLLSDRTIGLPCNFDLIYDGTMNNTKSYLPLIKLLKELGYKIFVVYIDNVPKDVIVDRALKRYQKSGRFVPLEVIDDFFSKGKSALNEIKKQVDGYMIVDGGNNNYDIIEEGGMKLPQNREYSKIGSPIK